MALLWQLSPFFLAAWLPVLLALLAPVRINLFSLRENKDDHLVIRVNTFFSLVRFQVEVPLLKQQTPLDLTVEAELKAGEDELVREKKKEVSIFDLDPEKLLWALSVYRNNRGLLMYAFRFMSRAITVERLHLRLCGGLGDAALTGLLFGAGWTAAGNVSTIMQKKLRFKEPPRLDLRPDFSQTRALYARLDTVISCRVGHFFLTGFMMLAAVIRGGEKRRWKTILSRG
jgi:hypothetical protein